MGHTLHAAWDQHAWSAGTIGASTSRFIFLGDEMDLGPVTLDQREPISKLLQGWLTPEALELSIWRPKQRRLWCRAVREKSVSINVLGASVTAGCGALAPDVRCEPKWSWTRFMSDRLTDVLRRSGRSEWRLDVRAFAKNAVEPGYFLQCMQSRFQLSSNTSVVLVELEAACLYYSNDLHRCLHDLFQQLRHAAPQAVLGFVGWPVGWGAVKGPAGYEQAFVSKTNQSSHVATALASRLLERAMKHGNRTKALFYADNVHPSLAGHAMLGDLAAYMVADGLLGSACAVSTDAPAEPVAVRTKALSTDIEHPSDVCVGSADQLPIASPRDRGWALVDEGGRKGVRKLGYLSTTPGAKLAIGPLLPQIHCGMYSVSLGYLQSWRPSMGALSISCQGCHCRAFPGYWASLSFPFPLVETAATSATFNASVTAMTRFFLFKSDADCFVTITHARSRSKVSGGQAAVQTHFEGGQKLPHQLQHQLQDQPNEPRAADAAPTHSRVRVDSIGLTASNCVMHCYLYRVTATRAFANEALSCASAAEHGDPAYVIPACLAKGNTCANRTLEARVRQNDPSVATGFIGG